jgi:AAA family ATP:ADP antiporter
VKLLLISALLLAAAVGCIQALNGSGRDCGEPERSRHSDRAAMGGSIFAGVKRALSSPYLLGICLFIWLYTTLATFLYLAQARIVADAFEDPATRTAMFAWIDFAVNILTIGIQTVLTGRIINWLGLPLTLTLIPMVIAGGFIGLGLAPVLPMVISFQVIRRAGEYAIVRPAREVLFTVVDVETKYKAKNFIDTVVYRGGDAISSWLYTGLTALGLSLSAIAFVAVPIAAIWGMIGYALGGRQETLKTVTEHKGHAAVQEA